MASQVGARFISAPADSPKYLENAGLIGVALLAIALRLLPAIVAPSLNWADEIFQTIEPAHRLVYGYGLVPWEFQLGTRSWLLPGAIAFLMEIARLIGDGPDYYLPIIAAAFAALSAAPVICCYLWCRRWFGLGGALVGGIAAAVAPELVYFGTRALTEVVAANIMVVALYLAQPGYPVGSRRRLCFAGALLGLVCLLRVQIAPAVALIAIWPTTTAWKPRIAAIALGATMVLFAGAAFDWLTLGYPLASVWRDVLYNLYYDVSADFGTSPWDFYLLGEIGVWGGGIAFLLLSIILGARRLPAALAAALVILAAHSAIGHKEYRFIYPAIALFAVLAGIGLAQLSCWIAQRLEQRRLSPLAAGLTGALLVLGLWGMVSADAWSGDTLARLRTRAHDRLMAMSYVGRLPGICGVGLYGLGGTDWAASGGYSYLHRRIPIYWPANASALGTTAPAFDVLISQKQPPASLGFKTDRCFGNVCVTRRAGSCAERPMAAMPFPAPIARMAPPATDFPALPPVEEPARLSRPRVRPP